MISNTRLAIVLFLHEVEYMKGREIGALNVNKERFQFVIIVWEKKS